MNFHRKTVFSGIPEILIQNFTDCLTRFGTDDGIASIKIERQLKDGMSHEAFQISVTADECVVTAYGECGAFYGAQELMRMAETGFGTGTRLETPSCKIRGVKLFLPPPTEKGFADFRMLVDMMCRYRCNFLLLETGGAMEYKSHPEINEGWVEYCNFMNEYFGKPREIADQYTWCKNSIHSTNGGGKVLTQARIAELLDYCRARHIEVVPELPSLSHCDYLLTRHPELSERPEDPYPDTVCPNHPDYYPLLFDLIDETLALFKPERMHLGHDEYLTIARCPRCRNTAPAKLYAGDIWKCRDYLHERGVKMMIWGEKLLSSRFSNGDPCGGSEQKIWHHPESDERIPATFEAIDMIPRDIEIMHWYWGIDRELEKSFVERGLPVLFGNFCGAVVPDWGKRAAEKNFLGTCCSNWGACDPITLQRNAILFEIAFDSILQWTEPQGELPHDQIRDAALKDLYSLKCRMDGAGRYMEITHTTNEKRSYVYFVDGYFVDEEKDLLGYHVFRADNGTEQRFPVIFGSNIVAENISLERGENKFFSEEGKTSPLYDQYSSDDYYRGAAFTALPEKRAGKTVCTCRFPLPDDGQEYVYAGFEPVDGFTGNVTLFEYNTVYTK